MQPFALEDKTWCSFCSSFNIFVLLRYSHPCFIINLFLTPIPFSSILQSRNCRKDLTVSDNFDFESISYEIASLFYLVLYNVIPEKALTKISGLFMGPESVTVVWKLFTSTFPSYTPSKWLTVRSIIFRQQTI